jgi:hypothetical protein
MDTTLLAEQIRETTGMAWEHACLAAERQRDADEMDAPSDWDAGTINFDPYV